VKREPGSKIDARQFAIDAAKTAADTRCTNVVVLDVRGQSPVTDYFVIGTGTSDRQMRAVADAVEEMAGPLGNRVINRSVDEHWILIDFVDVVVHVFSDEARHFYDLESLWGEAKRVEWKEK
jgi:ribosome-associated protein